MTTCLLSRSQPVYAPSPCQTRHQTMPFIDCMQGSRNTFLCRVDFLPRTFPHLPAVCFAILPLHFTRLGLCRLYTRLSSMFFSSSRQEIGKFHKIAGLVRPANLTCSLITPQPGLSCPPPLPTPTPLCESLPGHERGLDRHHCLTVHAMDRTLLPL